MSTPSISHRHQNTIRKKMQEGTIVSFTIVRHPPEGFPSHPRVIGLIELEDGTHALGQLLSGEHESIEIGQKVKPRMSLSRVAKDGLRLYDVSYEVVVPVREPVADFPGYILALTGPSGVGKSTISKMLGSAVSEYTERVPILTTRQPKNGDDGEYRYIPTKQFLSLEEKGDIVSATLIPSSSETRWYGYRAKDIEDIWAKGKIPIVITEMHLLQGLSKHYGRRSILSMGLLPPGSSKRTRLSALLHRLRTRGRDTEQQMEERLKNAEKDLAFFDEQKHLFDHLLVNEDLTTVIDTLKGHVLKTVKA